MKISDYIALLIVITSLGTALEQVAIVGLFWKLIALAVCLSSIQWRAIECVIPWIAKRRQARFGQDHPKPRKVQFAISLLGLAFVSALFICPGFLIINFYAIGVVCDEAHLYLPRKDGNPVERRAVEAFEKIAKEGRKYGVALMIISQRPSDVSATILSQCNNIISLRLTNADDQATVRKLLPESLESLLEALPIMDVGEAMVVGDSVLLPSRIKIEPPKEKPLSAIIDFWSRWQEDKTNPDFSIAVENMRRQSRAKHQS